MEENMMDEIIQEYKDLLEESKSLTEKYLGDLKNLRIENSRLKNQVKWRNIGIIGLLILTLIFIFL